MIRSFFRILSVWFVLILLPSCYNKNYTPQEWITDKQIAFNLDSQESTSSLDRMNWPDHPIVLFGEFHEFRDNYRIPTMVLNSVIKSSNESVCYVMESPPSRAALVNQYIKTGDEKLLSIGLHLSDDAVHPEQIEEHMMYRELHRIQMENPKIEFKTVGLDIEHEPDPPFSYLKYLLDQLSDEELREINWLKTSVMNWESGILNESKKEVIKKLQTDLAQNRRPYEERFPQEIDNLVSVINNYMNGMDTYQSISNRELFFKKRESYIIENAKFRESMIEDCSFTFGMWGFEHIIQGKQEASLAKFLRERYDKRLVSIGIVYNSNEAGIDPQTYFSDFKLLQSNITAKAVIIPLIGKGSPFATSLYFLKNHSVSGDTTDNLQYILYLNQPKIGTKLNDKG